MNKIKFLSILHIFLSICILFSPIDAKAYFLSIKQKAELLWLGNVTDKRKNVYNVRIMPGYNYGFNLGKTKWLEGGRKQKYGFVEIGKGIADIPFTPKHLKLYFSSSPYDGIKKGFNEAISGEKYLFSEFMGNNLIKAWQKYHLQAKNAHEKETFGWWLAYPWAYIKGTVNSTLRLGIGSIGSVFVAGYGIILRPSYELTKPLFLTSFDILADGFKIAKGGGYAIWGLGYDQLVIGTVTPISLDLWNTGVGIPLVLFGKEPTPESVDGWWVTLLPSSPAYIQELNKRYSSNIVNREKILKYELANLKYMNSLIPLKKEKEVSIKKIENYFNKKRNILQIEAFKDVEIPEQPEIKPQTMDFENAKEKIIEALSKNKEFLSLPKKEQDKVINSSLNKWGGYFLTNTKTQQKIHSKTNPNTLLKEEIEEVLNK